VLTLLPDLDSLTSSLLYSYLRSIEPPRATFAPLYVPLLNLSSSGLRLRPEFTAVCAHANISLSNLITLDDFSDRLGNVHFILVDHNKLQGELGKRYSASVHGVIDHHEEEYAVPGETEPEPRIVEKCGSCTSLVVHYCRPSWDCITSSSLSSGAAHGQGEAAVDDSAVVQGWDAQIAKMALASILIDTANLTAPGKVEKVDQEAVEYLETKIQMSAKHAGSWNRDEYYREIDEAKRDIDALTLGEILMKDYKEWAENGLNLGISSVVKPLEYLTKKVEADPNVPKFDDELAHFMEDRALSIFSIMTTSTTAEGEFKRELLTQVKEDGFTSLRNFAERAVSALQLEDVQIKGIVTQQDPVPGQIWRKTWLQGDLSKSRKQVAPSLRESMMAKRSPDTFS